MGYINLIYPIAHVWYINSRPNFLSLLLEVEDCEKTFNTAFTIYSKRCTKCNHLKPTTATIVELWDERIKRIKLTSIIYFIAEDEVSFYGLHWDLQQYRYFRLIGSSYYLATTIFLYSSYMLFLISALNVPNAYIHTYTA